MAGYEKRRFIRVHLCPSVVHQLSARSDPGWTRGLASPASAGYAAAVPKAFGTGGAEGIRTPDPHNAIVVLYQLSYDPSQSSGNLKRPGQLSKQFFCGRSLALPANNPMRNWSAHLRIGARHSGNTGKDGGP